MKEYDREIHSQSGTKGSVEFIHYHLNSELNNRIIAENNLQSGLHTMQNAMHKINRAFKKDIQSIKNQIEHEKLEHQIEQKNKNEIFY